MSGPEALDYRLGMKSIQGYVLGNMAGLWVEQIRNISTNRGRKSRG